MKLGPRKRSSQVTIARRLLTMNDKDLREAVYNDAAPQYPEIEPPKPLQVDAVLRLIRKRHTFVMAGTGFGKSRISEMYLHLFAPSKRGVVLVLNPLDALGDNQVKEKTHQGYTAINLKKMNFNPSIALEIKRGKYNFVYLSPEVYLNNQLFTDLYHDPIFQDRLALIVVDEAHMIYSWGLVENKKSRKIAAHKRHQDRSIFRPSYGDMGRQLLATNGTPILFLSATCRPHAVTEILKNLKIPEDAVDFVRAELTRPEIRILRFPMQSSLKSVNDLASMFGHQDKIADKEIVPTLIYSGTRNATLQVMKVVNDARGTHQGEINPDSTMIRRYHACTSDQDKEDVIAGFERDEFPCISCTMALGLGQNWKRVRRVIHMGRGDPSCICQMIGRCGRDGKNGLAILFVEPKRKSGINNLAGFEKADKQADDVRMDSLAMTPICLRIAFSVDNLYGYIPVDRNDANFLREEIREMEAGFPPCKCSNCRPEEAEILRTRMTRIDRSNFDAALESPEILEPVDLPPKKTRAKGNRSKETPLSGILNQFSDIISNKFNKYFMEKYGKPRSFPPSQLFNMAEAHLIASNVDNIQNEEQLDELIGGETIDGQSAMLFKTLEDFRDGVGYQAYLSEKKNYDIMIGLEMERLQPASRRQVNRTKRKPDEVSGSRPTTPEVRRRESGPEKQINQGPTSPKKKKITKAELRVIAKAASKKKWLEDQVVLEGYKKDALARSRGKEAAGTIS